jgi:hypothetical protein
MQQLIFGTGHYFVHCQKKFHSNILLKIERLLFYHFDAQCFQHNHPIQMTSDFEIRVVKKLLQKFPPKIFPPKSTSRSFFS